MSDITHAVPSRQRVRNDVLRTTISKQCIDLRIPSGGARRDRTDDLMLAKHALSQLSYGPVPEDECLTSIIETSLFREKPHSIKVVGLGRLELPTSRLSSARSNQLSYKPLTREARSLARNQLTPMHRTSASPWRVFVREERETKTAKPRQCSSTILTIAGH